MKRLFYMQFYGWVAVGIALLASCGRHSAEPSRMTAADSAYVSQSLAREAVRTDCFVTTDTLYDFGTLTDTAAVNHRFVFVNKGKQPVVIDTVISHCNCTSVAYDGRPVPVGGQGSVTVTYTPLVGRGSFYKTLRVMLNGGAQYALVAVKGKVERNDK